MRRDLLKGAKRIVVKLGTGILTDARKQTDPVQMEQLVAQVTLQRQSGKQIVVVTSGAVGAGMGILGFNKRPPLVSDLQACAAIGQSRLMAAYEKLFSQSGFHIAQVLLTHADLQNKERHQNARNTLLTLLRRGVIPVINENDVVSTTELRFGDNDRLSALVAALLPADLLIILTTVEGLMEDYGREQPRILSTIPEIDERIESLAGGTTSITAVGGMKSKIQAAKIVVRSGIPLVIASGRKQDVLARVLGGQEEGTFFSPQSKRLPAHKRWIAFFHNPKGSLIVDGGAEKALREKGRSLLPPGIVRCEGTFHSGDIVSIRNSAGVEFGRGITRLDSDHIQARRFAESEVVHRGHLVIL